MEGRWLVQSVIACIAHNAHDLEPINALGDGDRYPKNRLHVGHTNLVAQRVTRGENRLAMVSLMTATLAPRSVSASSQTRPCSSGICDTGKYSLLTQFTLVR